MLERLKTTKFFQNWFEWCMLYFLKKTSNDDEHLDFDSIPKFLNKNSEKVELH